MVPHSIGRGAKPSVWTGLALLFSTAHAIVMPDGSTGKVPSLGWNSWNAYHCEIDESKFLSAAEVIVSSGLLDAGYQYVNIDDCWSLKDGRVDGHIAANTTRFPAGIDGLADKVHDLGLKLGIYSTAGTATCAGYPASLGYEEVDAADFANWGVDYLKYDNCNVPTEWQDQYVACNQDAVQTGPNGTCTTALEPNLAPPGYDWSTSKSAERFNAMRDALANQSREIVLSLCIWGEADVFSWGNSTGISWRMSGDISPEWSSVTHIINMNSFKMNYVGFWGHNDADMLEVGNGNLTAAETRTHFALWAAMKSPLLIGTDLTQLSQENIELLKNKHLLAFNQDSVYGQPATPYKWGVNPDWTFNSTNPAEYWAGPSSKGHLVLLMNTLGHTVTKEAKWSEIPGLSAGRYEVRDVWTDRSLGCLSSYKTAVAAHDTAAVLVGSKCRNW
ncbi:glycoside hydrolase family 27 protein [Trichoderma novae-zelandiae]